MKEETTDAATAPRPLTLPAPPVVIDAMRAAAERLELWRFRDLIATLAERDIRLRCRPAALGIGRVFLRPVATSPIFAVLCGPTVEHPHSSDVAPTAMQLPLRVWPA